MLVDILLWLPVKLLTHLLRPVTEMIDSIADNADAAIKQYEKYEEERSNQNQ